MSAKLQQRLAANEQSNYGVFFMCADGSVVDTKEALQAFNEEYLR